MYTVKELLEMCRAAIPVSNANAVYHIGQALLTAPDTLLPVGEPEPQGQVVVVVATAGAIKAAREAGVDLLDVSSGSGQDGQITLSDVHDYIKEIAEEDKE
jgi:pyruvate/2-oxoglutarate dehydrogenase complex dihydrolipoamide acyltransferase (E2) component